MRPSLPRERLFLLLCVCWRSRGTRPIWRPTVLRERCLFFFFFFFFFACVSREDGNGLERTFLDSFNNFFFLFFFDSLLLLLLLLQRLFSIPLLFCACGSVRKEIPYNPLPTTSFFFSFSSFWLSQLAAAAETASGKKWVLHSSRLRTQTDV